MNDRGDDFGPFARTNQLILRARLGRDAGLIVALLLLIRAWRAPASPERPVEPGERWKALAALAALAVYTFALEPLGFVLATTALLLFFFRVIDGQRWWVALGSAVAISVLAYLVFAHGLHVRLPGAPWS